MPRPRKYKKCNGCGRCADCLQARVKFLEQRMAQLKENPPKKPGQTIRVGQHWRTPKAGKRVTQKRRVVRKIPRTTQIPAAATPVEQFGERLGLRLISRLVTPRAR